MARPAMPHPHLIVLRSAATIVLSSLIAQAGWAAAFLGGEGQYAVYHRVGAWVTLAVTVAAAVVYLYLRRSAGMVNVVLAVLLAVVLVVQFTLGVIGETGVHIFLGILIAMLGTALTSWTYRHTMPEAAPRTGSRPAWLAEQDRLGE